MHVKRSRLPVCQEARSQNLVSVGGLDTNHPQRKLPDLRKFGFGIVVSRRNQAIRR